MKKKTFIWLTVCFVVINFVVGAIVAIHYYFNAAQKEWFRVPVHEGEYTVVGYDVGNLLLPGGYTNARIEILNKSGTCIVDFRKELFKDSVLTSDQYQVETTDEYIKVVLIGSDKKQTAYRFYFEDYQ